jgi:uncharacterized damage-inducible protein DinB
MKALKSRDDSSLMTAQMHQFLTSMPFHSSAICCHSPKLSYFESPKDSAITHLVQSETHHVAHASLLAPLPRQVQPDEELIFRHM